MRLEIPGGFNVGPLMTALEREAANQGHRVTGEIVNGECVLIFRPLVAPMRGALPGLLNLLRLTSSVSTSPGLTVIEHHVDELGPKVIPITRGRAARGGNSTPPRAA